MGKVLGLTKIESAFASRELNRPKDNSRSHQTLEIISLVLKSVGVNKQIYVSNKRVPSWRHSNYRKRAGTRHFYRDSLSAKDWAGAQVTDPH